MMNRKLGVVAMLAGALAVMASVVHAQVTYPTKPVRMIVAFPPGQATDIIARLVADELTKAWGQQVIVENRAGGDSIPGTMVGRNAPADGYTITFGTSSSFAVNPAIFSKLPYDPPKDFTMVHGVFSVPWVIVAHPSAPYNTLADLVDAAKRNPNTIQWGYGSSSLQLGAELFKLRSGAQIGGVPYKGSGPATTDLMGGHVMVLIDTVAATLQNARAGKIKVLATLAPQRVPLMPDAPTVSEAGFPGAEAEGWGGMAVPKATPAVIVERISAEVGRIVNDPAIQRRMLDRGTVPDPRGAKEWSVFVEAEVAKWTDIARRANVKSD
ncbi:MAG: Bug family tripartite tricarboxylate transporter substrate binding protein [Burkholderiales bacterium]